jgi:hypothetical protein
MQSLSGMFGVSKVWPSSPELMQAPDPVARSVIEHALSCDTHKNKSLGMYSTNARGVVATATKE